MTEIYGQQGVGQRGASRPCAGWRYTGRCRSSECRALPGGAPAAVSIVHIETERGEEILTLVPVKTYQSVVLCSSVLKKGKIYVIYSGGRSTGTADDGLYSCGKYTTGTKITNLTITGMVTTYGAAGMNPGGTGGGMRREPPSV